MSSEIVETAFNTESTETRRTQRKNFGFLCALRVSVFSVVKEFVFYRRVVRADFHSIPEAA
jgi:hypothetical protein